MFTMQVKNTGITTLVKSGNAQMSNNPVKIYINSHELNSATIGNALTQYGKMGLYFIDHIEVYQAGNSVVFGNEPGTMIIKLYTKEPSRENGTSTQASLDSRGSLNLRALDARAFGKYSYLANIDFTKNNYEIYNNNNSDFSRDGHRGQFYVKFSKDKSYDLEVSASHELYDTFSGLGSTPADGSYLDTKNIYAQFSKYFDNDLTIRVSASNEKLHIDSRDKVGIMLVDNTLTNSIEGIVGTDIYNAIVEKRFINGANDLFLGAHYKHQKFKIDSYKNAGLDKPTPWGPTELDTYMAYLENLYNLNEKHLIALSAKVDHYENNFSKSSTQHILRVGYVALIDKSLTFKLFAMQSYIYPIFLQTTFAPNYNINPYLDSAKANTLTTEIIYKLDKTEITIGGGGSEIKNAIVFNMQKKQYVNNPDKGAFTRGYARLEHKFDIQNKLTLEYFKIFKEKYFSPEEGGLIQLFNQFWKLDIYNELIYRSAYKSLDGVEMSAGYDYSLGVIYPISRSMELKLKGENLLDMASEVPISGLEVPVVERRALLTMEYTF